MCLEDYKGGEKMNGQTLETIQYPVQCETCSQHLTDLGTLKSLEEAVGKNFPAWSLDKKAELIIAWFERSWKQEMALQIQKSKKDNIKAINK